MLDQCMVQMSVLAIASGASDCSDGQLKLYNGVDNSDDNPTLVPCGDADPLIFNANGNEVFVEYSYDSSQEEHGGFILIWFAGDL